MFPEFDNIKKNELRFSNVSFSNRSLFSNLKQTFSAVNVHLNVYFTVWLKKQEGACLCSDPSAQEGTNTQTESEAAKQHMD